MKVLVTLLQFIEKNHTCPTCSFNEVVQFYSYTAASELLKNLQNMSEQS